MLVQDLYLVLQACARFYILLCRLVQDFISCFAGKMKSSLPWPRHQGELRARWLEYSSSDSPGTLHTCTEHWTQISLKIILKYFSLTHQPRISGSWTSPPQDRILQHWQQPAELQSSENISWLKLWKIFDLSWDEVGLWLRKKLDWLTGEHELIRVTLIINNLVSTCLHQQ